MFQYFYFISQIHFVDKFFYKLFHLNLFNNFQFVKFNYHFKKPHFLIFKYFYFFIQTIN